MLIEFLSLYHSLKTFLENNTHQDLEPVVRRRFHIELWALAYTADEVRFTYLVYIE